MKTHLDRISFASVFIFVAVLWVPQVHGQESEQKEVERTVRQYFTAMSARDLETLRSVLDKRFVAIKATRENAQSYVVDAADPQNIVPRNDDWNSIKLGQLKIELSATHPTIANASYELLRPLDARGVAAMETAVKDREASFNETEKQAMAKMITDRAVTGLGFAMLARRDGKWKIVSLTFPKL